MKIKLADYPYIEKYIISVFDNNNWFEKDFSYINEHVFIKSKYKNKINKVIIYRNTGIESSIGFYKDDYKGQQPIYTPFTEIYGITMEDTALLRFVFKL